MSIGSYLRAGSRLLPSITQQGTKVGPRLAAMTAPVVQAGAQFLGNPFNRSLVGGTIGAATNQDGTLGGRVRGALLGGTLSTLPLGIPGSGMAQSAISSKLMAAGLNPNLAQNLVQTAVPLGLLGLGANQGYGGAGNQGKNLLAGGAQSAAGLFGYKTPSGEFVPLGDPSQVGGMFGGVPQIGGNPLDVVNLAGRDSARRLGQVKDAETLRDTINMVLPTVEKFSDRAKQRDLQRNLAAAGVRANIEANVEQLLNAQKAVQQMGADAQRGAVNALQSQYNYS
tara:strand:- start:1238 stop:2083 length:846 start_codon:yes stop_codon:yes gene_type:complete